MIWLMHIRMLIKFKMCHSTKVNMSHCHLGKDVALTAGGTAYSPEPKLPSPPPWSDTRTPTNNRWGLFSTLWQHHTLNPAAKWPLNITAGICQRVSYMSWFVTREISWYTSNGHQSILSHTSENFTRDRRHPTAAGSRRKVGKDQHRSSGSSSGGSWVFAISGQMSRWHFSDTAWSQRNLRLQAHSS